MGGWLLLQRETYVVTSPAGLHPQHVFHVFVSPMHKNWTFPPYYPFGDLTLLTSYNLLQPCWRASKSKRLKTFNFTTIRRHRTWSRAVFSVLKISFFLFTRKYEQSYQFPIKADSTHFFARVSPTEHAPITFKVPSNYLKTWTCSNSRSEALDSE